MDDLINLCEYSCWADQLLLESIRGLTPEQFALEPAPGCPSIRATLVHMADAQWIWVRRIQGETVTARITEVEKPTREEAEQFLDQAHETLHRLLPTVPVERLVAPLSYVDLKGEPQSLPLKAILWHLINHASYHRGQITASLMRLGIEPPIMDLALWARQQE